MVSNNTFFYQVYVPLTIVTNTDGVVSSAGGTVKPTVSSAGTPTNDAPLGLGKIYTVTASPAPNNLFSNWFSVVNGVTSLASSAAKYYFPMQSNLTLIANFAANRFIGAAGTYYGLFQQTNEVTPQSAGFIKVTASAKALRPGTCSGSLTLAGEKVNFAGTFDAAGDITLPVSFKSASVTLRLHLAADGSDTVTGSVRNNDGSWTAELKANRAVYKASNPATAYVGRYTMVIPGAINAAVAPGGDGYGVVTVSASGTIALAGSLGDGAL